MNRVVCTSLAGVIAIAVLTALPRPAAADRYYASPYHPHQPTVILFPKGVYVGASLMGTRILDQQGGQDLLEDGAGFAAFAGIRLNPRLAVEGGWSATIHNPTTVDTPFGADTDYLVLHGLTADAKLFLTHDSSKTMEPYLQGGVGVYLLDRTYFGTESIGTGFQLGGGIDFSASPRVRLGLRALYRGLSMGPPSASVNDTFISAASVEANVSLRF